VLIGYISSDKDPAYFETTPEDIIKKNITDALKMFYNKKDIPQPDAFLRSTWGSDPNFFGSGCYISTDCDNTPTCTQDNLVAPISITRSGTSTPVIFFANDCTDKTGVLSSLEGAYLAGLDAAKRVASAP
jgi:hypothetical protein